MANTRKASARTLTNASKQHFKSPPQQQDDGSTYVNTMCSLELYNAAMLYARDNGLNTAQDVLRVAATKFLKGAGYLSK